MCTCRERTLVDGGDAERANVEHMPGQARVRARARVWVRVRLWSGSGSGLRLGLGLLGWR